MRQLAPIPKLGAVTLDLLFFSPNHTNDPLEWMTSGCCSGQGPGWECLWVHQRASAALAEVRFLESDGSAVPGVTLCKPSGCWEVETVSIIYWICFSSSSDLSWTSPCFWPPATLAFFYLYGCWAFSRPGLLSCPPAAPPPYHWAPVRSSLPSPGSPVTFSLQSPHRSGQFTCL